MFLAARLFAVLVYACLMFLFIFLIRQIKHSQVKYVFIAYFIVLCLMAYLYVPYETADIFRNNIIAQSLAQYSWAEFWYIITNSTSDIFTLLYFRYFADYLCLVTCAIMYGLIFYMIYDFSMKMQVRKAVIALVLLWIMTNDFYLISITNIRSYIAVIFVAFCIYREIFQHKFGILNIILYLCAIEMHSMGIILVAFRIIAYLSPGGKINIWKIVSIPLILVMLVVAFPWYQDLLFKSAERFEGYYNWVDYNYVWERVIFIIQTIVQGFILWKAHHYRLFKSSVFSSYQLTVIGAFVAFLICHLHVTFMQRWIVFSAILEIPVLIALLQKCYTQKDYSLRNFLIFSSLVTFAIVGSRGNLCSLKFWE